MKRRLTKVFVFFMALAFCLPSYCYAVEININGQCLATDTEPVIENSRVFVPARVIAENLGASVAYNAQDRTVDMDRGDTHIHITIGSPDLWFSDKEKSGPISLDTPAFIKNNRTMLPVRAISELFGMQVDWDAPTQTVLIWENAPSQVLRIDGNPVGDEVVQRLTKMGVIPSSEYFTEASYMTTTVPPDQEEEGYFVTVRRTNPYDNNLVELVGHYFINFQGTLFMKYNVESDIFEVIC
ncbi:copper amine oxidase N-terminal domain-containing protein [Peptococcus niger]|uniref:Copper amine oxidase N-terminal domain-containing protein n=1 Tax=Peptococcus niger TaxID=2741 RepID=A0A1G6TI97_PEPNI|nr:copper amine oxidase N-terminal domain-containing protein [Peptococcus niger]SDD28055.1 Copper amine oxidase N-terminal domain-containing protein [Peptococcus niger]